MCRQIVWGAHPAYLLIMVLVFLFLAAGITVSLSESMLRNIRSAATASARDDLRLTAFSAMEISLAALSEIKELDGKLHSPSQGWGDPISYSPVAWPANQNVTVTIADETGRIPLNPVDRERLQQFFDQLGIDYTTSEELIDAYLDWIDEDDLERLNGAEADYYERLSPPVTPPNQPIKSHDDFRYIKGYAEIFFNEDGSPNALFKQFKESTTFHHEYDVNINSASPAVLGMLEENSGLDRRALEDLQYGLDGIPGTEDDGWPASSDDITINSDAAVGYEAHVFRITVRVEQGGKQFQLSALVDDGSSSSSSSSDSSDSSSSEDDSTDSTNDRSLSATGGNSPSLSINTTGSNTESEADSTSTGTSSSTSDSEATVLYVNGDWRFLEFNENRPEDG
ncbi:general secretion pathway protein GspK [Cerasicoccus maritimus]|uniref:general secretion pathway protein GspK n=1 Tax=Cerasicoccus maritimus TaxID=490089 RepID=UPI00285265A2|nr:type II secretion system protein GspK [Cerasicoccus maritimus]